MKRITSILLALMLTLAVFAFSGCSNEENQNAVNQSKTTITVGASSTPHAEILEVVKEDLKEKGYTLNIAIYDDYVLPNSSLAGGALEANYFQHKPYLDSYNEANETTLVSAAAIHYEPFGIYGKGITKLEELKSGATIIIPADDSNETRALLLLAQEGLITLPAGASALAGVTTLDIVDAKGYKITPVQADTVAAQLNNSDIGTIAVINGNYALAAGLNIKDALALEDASGDAATTYANIIAVRKEDIESDKTKVLVEALKTEKVKKFIEEKFEGAVVPMF